MIRYGDVISEANVLVINRIMANKTVQISQSNRRQNSVFFYAIMASTSCSAAEVRCHMCRLLRCGYSPHTTAVRFCHGGLRESGIHPIGKSESWRGFRQPLGRFHSVQSRSASGRVLGSCARRAGTAPNNSPKPMSDQLARSVVSESGAGHSWLISGVR